MKRIIMLITLFCSVLLLAGCDLGKKNSEKKVEETKSLSAIEARDKGNSVVCTMEDPIDNSTYRKILELMGQDSGKTYTGYTPSGERIYTGNYDQFFEDRDIIIGKKYTQKVFVWNEDNSRITDAYRIITHEFTDAKITNEMIEAVKKSMEEELNGDGSKGLYESSKVSIDGKKVIAELKIDISEEDEEHITQSKQTIFDNNDGEYYKCKIN